MKFGETSKLCSQEIVDLFRGSGFQSSLFYCHHWLHKCKYMPRSLVDSTASIFQKIPKRSDLFSPSFHGTATVKFFPWSAQSISFRGKSWIFFSCFCCSCGCFVHKAFIGSRKSDGVIEIVRTYYRHCKKKLKYWNLIDLNWKIQEEVIFCGGYNHMENIMGTARFHGKFWLEGKVQGYFLAIVDKIALGLNFWWGIGYWASVWVLHFLSLKFRNFRES